MAQSDAERFLTLQELSEYCRLSVATIHRLKRQGRLPFYQPTGRGGRLLFPVDAIERASAVAAEGNALTAARTDPLRRLSGRSPKWMQTNNQEQ